MILTVAFDSLKAFSQILHNLPVADAASVKAATDRNNQLTKPPGALGRLEDLAIWYAGWRGKTAPQIVNPQVVVFAGNHGVTAHGVSAFPAEVTKQMVFNFQAGGAAINQICRCSGAKMTVCAMELDRPTADFTREPAMSEEEVVQALHTGWNAVDPLCDLLVCGEMGIGNTTVAAAVANGLFGGEAENWVGRGTGIGDEGLLLKARVVRQAITLHASILHDPLQVLRCLGGRELAAMAGAVTRARVECIPVILDGFISVASAAVLARSVGGALDHCVAGHQSAEAAHGALLGRLGMEPLLNLGLRLGEGTGGALAIGILQSAVACHSGMATFAQAGVSDG